jgi:uncharacterized small protein (DUF1192 family)
MRSFSNVGRTPMAELFEDLPKPRPRTHVVGEELSTFSVDELDERIDQLRAEIGRLEQARAAKEASRHAADGFFKR